MYDFSVKCHVSAVEGGAGERGACAREKCLQAGRSRVTDSAVIPYLINNSVLLQRRRGVATTARSGFRRRGAQAPTSLRPFRASSPLPSVRRFLIFKISTKNNRLQ